MKLNKLLCGLALVAALGGVTSCAQEETLYGTYVDDSGRSSYITNVLVVVKGDTIVEVTIAEGSTHYTQGSSKWTGESWTSKESEFLATFAGKSIDEIKAAETYDVVAGATATSGRVLKAVQNALESK